MFGYPLFVPLSDNSLKQPSGLTMVDFCKSLLHAIHATRTYTDVAIKGFEYSTYVMSVRSELTTSARMCKWIYR